MYLLKNATTKNSVYVSALASASTLTAAERFCSAVAALTGGALPLVRVGAFTGEEQGVVLALFDEVKSLSCLYAKKTLCEGEGFCITECGKCVWVLSHTARGLYFGAHDLLEKNASVVYARGANEYAVETLTQKSLRLTVKEYAENPAFAVRAWNLCGVGTEGIEHEDEGTARYLSANKSNAISHSYKAEYQKYALFGSGVPVEEIGNLDFLSAEHPEWFMTAPDGGVMPAHCGWDSFLNYYDEQLAKEFARRLVSGLEKSQSPDVVPSWIMPDNTYFCMIKDGVRLHEQPFTADDGTVVYPEDKNYRSTVYFNFLNRVMKEANALRPNTYLQVFAYTYSEQTPAIEVDERLIVLLAPIQTNEKYAYTDRTNHDNDEIRDNIERWSKKVKRLGIYTYWNSFRGSIYSRPNLRIVKENLLWFKKLGVYQVLVEGKTDCSLTENMTAAQRRGRTFYDMNEAYIWILHKLLWNPEQDVDELLKRYVKIVYKECAKQMLRYFSLLQRGWDSKDALVWYATGGDVYYLQFVVQAGVADKILQALGEASQKAKTESVRVRVQAIESTVRGEIEKYKTFVKEEAIARYCGLGEEQIVSEEQMDFLHNANSVWAKAVPIKVLRDYGTMAFYPEQANFSCRMLYDEENMYIGYAVFDDNLQEKRKQADGSERYFRTDGSELIAYAETYIGGNAFNRTVYYGYISGFMGEKNEKGQFYVNAGSPKSKPIPDGVRDVRFVSLSDNPKERYHFHVQVIPFSALNVAADMATPYGSFVYYTNRFGRAGWMGYGLWSKQNFQSFTLLDKNK